MVFPSMQFSADVRWLNCELSVMVIARRSSCELALKLAESARKAEWNGLSPGGTAAELTLKLAESARKAEWNGLSPGGTAAELALKVAESAPNSE
jgi:hypothetical protein